MSALLCLVVATPALADGRHFTYTYEVTTPHKGEVEYEQWVTWKTDKPSDSTFNRVDFRHELELGITDNFAVAIYLADWRFESSKGDTDTFYRDSGVELVYRLTDPVEDPIGVALYGELLIGDKVIELEGKLLLQKNLGPWIVAYNLVIEAEWEGAGYDEESKGVLENILGVSYQLIPALSVGGELVHEIEWAEWAGKPGHVVYLGPTVSFRQSKWFITVTQLFQLTRRGGEADFQTRMIFGIEF
ncbi:MAG: hypothetical protein GC164_15275 [Phycisphaera sp.]|nr:hypothetical protein [Phycisphaera sp.]